MYLINHTDYGLRLRLSGTMLVNEVKAFGRDLDRTFETIAKPFSVFVDMRDLLPIDEPAQQEIIAIQLKFLKAGAVKSVVVLNNPTTTYQFKRIALQSEVYDYERYIDASADPDWESNGLKWLVDDIDPDAEWREEIARRSQTVTKERE